MAKSFIQGKYLLRRSRQLLALCAIGVASPVLARLVHGQSAALDWALDLVVHWQWLYAGCGALAALLVFRDAWRPRLVALLVVAALFAAPWLTAATPAQGQQDSSSGFASLTLASANVHLDNSDAQQVARWLEASSVDVAVLLEVSPDFAKNLERVPGFPYRRVVPRGDPFGIAVISKVPVESVRVLGSAERPYLEVHLQKDGRRAVLYAVHPMPPFEPAYLQERDQLLTSVAKQAAASAIPAVVLGDFNASPWSAVAHVMAANGLSRASGLSASWPSDVAPLVGLRLDNVYVSSGWRLRSTESGPKSQSDHLPVLTRLGWPR